MAMNRSDSAISYVDRTWSSEHERCVMRRGVAFRDLEAMAQARAG